MASKLDCLLNSITHLLESLNESYDDYYYRKPKKSKNDHKRKQDRTEGSIHTPHLRANRPMEYLHDDVTLEGLLTRLDDPRVRDLLASVLEEHPDIAQSLEHAIRLSVYINRDYDDQTGNAKVDEYMKGLTESLDDIDYNDINDDSKDEFDEEEDFMRFLELEDENNEFDDEDDEDDEFDDEDD